MTEKQKSRIKELKINGYGYKRIAKEMELTPACVKSYIRRNPLEETKKEAIDKCKNCDSLLVYIPGHRKKKFCNDKCRMAWWNSHLDKVKRFANHTEVCSECKKKFTAYGQRERKYCSRECYFRARFGGKRYDSIKPEVHADN